MPEPLPLWPPGTAGTSCVAGPSARAASTPVRVADDRLLSVLPAERVADLLAGGRTDVVEGVRWRRRDGADADRDRLVRIADADRDRPIRTADADRDRLVRTELDALPEVRP